MTPDGGLIEGTDGNLYGVTTLGGNADIGTLYKITQSGTYSFLFVRSIGRVGAPVEILGQGLTGTTSVTFNGVPATSFNVVSDTYMTATVPTGATTGPVVVTTPTGTLTSNKNFVVPGTATLSSTRPAPLSAR